MKHEFFIKVHNQNSETKDFLLKELQNGIATFFYNFKIRTV